jgi:hypothetical protein
VKKNNKSFRKENYRQNIKAKARPKINKNNNGGDNNLITALYNVHLNIDKPNFSKQTAKIEIHFFREIRIARAHYRRYYF